MKIIVSALCLVLILRHVMEMSKENINMDVNLLAIVIILTFAVRPIALIFPELTKLNGVMQVLIIMMGFWTWGSELILGCVYYGKNERVIINTLAVCFYTMWLYVIL